jgi:hypothetical protein
MKAGELEVCRKVYWRNLTTDGSEVASTQVCTLLSVTPAKFSAVFVRICPLPQYSHGDRYPVPAGSQVLPASM